MRNAYLLTLPTVLMLTSLVGADEVVLVEEIAQSTQPTQTQMQTQQPAETIPNFYEYHNRMAVFSTCHLTYERIQTDAFYVGVEGWVLPAISNKNHHGHHHSGSAELIAEAELRMGYNYFYNGRDHVTPFIGVGFFKDLHHENSWWWDEENNRHNHHGQKAGVVYGVFGFLYDHEFNSVFTLGVNLKGIIGGPVSHKHHHWGSVVGGVDVAVPITFRFGSKRHWDIRLEPFNIFMHGSDLSRNYFGGRSTVGYRF
jgi:hypothetical protein